jgi:L-glyceraldehyde 3-phosphate reductase
MDYQAADDRYTSMTFRHPGTPLEETMGALDAAVRHGKALYAGIANYSPEQHRRAVQILKDLGTPLLLHQAAYSMLRRSVEDGVLDAVGDTETSLIAFSPLAQGLLTDRYVQGIPADSRMAVGHFLKSDALSEEKLELIRALAKLAERRGQTLAQLALSWVLRDPRVVSVIVGASSVAQLDQNLAALEAAPPDADELAEIEGLLTGGGDK